jgi:hypothetical protein
MTSATRNRARTAAPRAGSDILEGISPIRAKRPFDFAGSAFVFIGDNPNAFESALNPG